MVFMIFKGLCIQYTGQESGSQVCQDAPSFEYSVLLAA